MSDWGNDVAVDEAGNPITPTIQTSIPATSDWGNDTMVPDDSQSSQINLSSTPTGFAARESSDWAKRNQQLQGIEQRDANGQSYPQTLLQNAGNIAGRVIDVAGNAVGSGVRYANDLIPQSVDDAVSAGASQAKNYIGNTDFGKGASYLANQGSAAYSQFARSNPNTAADLNAIGNIVQVAPLAKPAMLVADTAGSIVSDGAKALLPAVSPGVVDIAANAADASLPLTVGQVAPDSILGKGLNALKILPLSGSNAPAFQGALNKAVLDAAGIDGDVMTAPALQARAKDLGTQFQSYTNNKVFPSADLRTTIPTLVSNVPKDTAAQLKTVTDPLMAEANIGPVSGEALNTARIAANDLARNADDYGTRKAASQLHDTIVNTIVGQDPAKAAQYKDLLGQYKAYKTVEDTYAQSKAGNVDPTAFQQAVMRNYGGDSALINTPMGQLAKAATTYGTKPSLPWRVGSGLLGLGEVAATIHSPELAIPAILANRGLQSFINRNPAVVRAIMNKPNLASIIPKASP